MSPRCCISVTSDDASRDVTDRRWCFFASDFLRHWCSFIIPRFAICRYAGWRSWWPKITKTFFLSLSFSRIRSLISKTVGPNITPLNDNGSTLRKDWGFLGFFFFFPIALTPNNFLGRQVLRKKTPFLPLGSIIPAARFEPGTAGCKARTLPLCYAVPPRIG